MGMEPIITTTSDRDKSACRSSVRLRLAGLVRGLLSRKHIKHAIVAAESDDGRFHWCGAGGNAGADSAPMTEYTPFHIASVDKMFTASVILKLRERGHVDLGQPIAAYLPEKLVARLHRLDGIDHTSKITVRHLLGHTSGLADCLEDRPKGGRTLMERLFTDGDLAFTVEDLMNIVRNDLVPHFPPQPLNAPHQRARYSDTNYQLLIAVIESVTGGPVFRAFEDMLFAPLGMQHTFMFGFSHTAEPTPEPAVVMLHGNPLDVPMALRSFPSVYSTVGDCFRFMRALSRCEVFEDPATLAVMQERWNRFGLPLDKAALRAPGWPVEYGLGLMRFRLPQIFNGLRRMPAVIGHTGSTGSWLFHCPELGLLLCGTADEASAGAVPYRVVPKMLRVLSTGL